MKQLDEMNVSIHSAHPYLFVGHFSEEDRRCNLYAFHLFLEGKGFVQLGDRKFPADKGTLLFIRPGERHSFRHVTGNFYAVNVYGQLWTDPNRKIAETRFAFGSEPLPADLCARTVPCAELDSLPGVSSIRAFPALMEQFAQTAKRFGDTIPYSSPIVKSLFYAWILQWHNAVNRLTPYDYRIMRVMDEIERYPEKQLSYAELCRRCGLEKSYFYRLFRQQTGMTPKEYQLKVKMKQAAVMLRESNKTVSRIAEELGYSSVHYFSRQFAGCYHMPPTRFRNRPAE